MTFISSAKTNPNIFRPRLSKFCIFIITLAFDRPTTYVLLAAVLLCDVNSSIFVESRSYESHALYLYTHYSSSRTTEQMSQKLFKQSLLFMVYDNTVTVGFRSSHVPNTVLIIVVTFCKDCIRNNKLFLIVLATQYNRPCLAFGLL